jgi:hypothetical protein
MNRIDHRHSLVIHRSAAALWAASFLFFLLYSAPHQVHHFFEQLPKANYHGNDEHQNTDRDGRSSTEPNCVFQISASRCHLGLAWQVAPVLWSLLVSPLAFVQAVTNTTNFRPASFQIRAPPLAQ